MDELERLQAEIEEMQQKAEALKKARKAEVIAEMKAKIAAYGLTAKDLGLSFSEEPSSHTRTPAPIKYCLDGNTWTGRGKRPRFITAYLEAGGKLEDLAV